MAKLPTILALTALLAYSKAVRLAFLTLHLAPFYLAAYWLGWV